MSQVKFFVDIIYFKRGIINNRESYSLSFLSMAKALYISKLKDYKDCGYDVLYVVYSCTNKLFIYLCKLIKTNLESEDIK